MPSIYLENIVEKSYSDYHDNGYGLGNPPFAAPPGFVWKVGRPADFTKVHKPAKEAFKKLELFDKIKKAGFTSQQQKLIEDIVTVIYEGK